MKALLSVMLVAIVVMFTQINEFYSSDKTVYFTPAIKAIIFGMMAVSAVFIGMLPSSTKDPREGNPGKIEDKLAQIAGCTPACLSGWYSLVAATNGNPTPYILPLIAIYILLGLVILPTAVTEVRLWFKNRSK